MASKHITISKRLTGYLGKGYYHAHVIGQLPSCRKADIIRWLEYAYDNVVDLSWLVKRGVGLYHYYGLDAEYIFEVVDG